MTTTVAASPRPIAKPDSYAQLMELAREAHLLGSSVSLLGWDQETMMPDGGLEHRGRQLALLARLTHERLTDERMGDLLAACEADESLIGDPLSPEAVNIRELRRLHDRRTRLPAALVAEEAMLSSMARHEWAEARKASDFKRFEPWLEKIVKLLRRKAECYGWDKRGETWDALAEDYEPGCTAVQVAAVFAPLRQRLQALLDSLAGSPRQPNHAFNELALPIEQQMKFVRFVAQQIGFDFQRGRLDLSTHPFCSGTHCGDVRMTTRFTPNCVLDGLGSTMHESGHGVYEQGLLAEHVGTPMGEAVSLGIHESQSRMWENQVGRSRAFWSWCFTKLPEFFGGAPSRLSLQDVYDAANIVEPGFIRVEADETTYNLHIMIRFEIERALMKGDMMAADVPGAWNQKYKEYLGLTVPDDRRGCLQDIHWSMTSMGYFPTYTLGNLYAAQFFEKVLADIPDLHAQFERGQFGALKSWLNVNIHAHGQRYRAAELCEHVTGKPLSAGPLLRHLESKLKPLYGL